MKYDIVIAGVGGQGILAVATIIAKAAMQSGLTVRQSEIHGMSQRGGNVSAYVRIADSTIHSDIIPNGEADMILSMEPLESLRYLKMLAKDGVLLTAKEPFANIPNYPDVDEVYNNIKSVKNSVMVDGKELAKEDVSTKALNVALIGAAAPYLPIDFEHLEQATADLFAKKGDVTVAMNLNALHIGKEKGAATDGAGADQAGSGLKM